MPLASHAPIYKFVGKNLRKVRLDRGLTQAQVADVLKVSPQQYQKYEDAQSRATIAVVLLLARYYGIGASSFIEGAPLPSDLPIAGEESKSTAEVETIAEEALLLRLVAAFSKLPTQEERRHVVAMIEDRGDALLRSNLTA